MRALTALTAPTCPMPCYSTQRSDSERTPERGYAATRLRGYAATPRGYAATVDNDGHINQQPNRGHVDSRVTDAPTSNIT